jgi:hypothetical protein
VSTADKIWYLSWRTWCEHEVSTPWSFWYLCEGREYVPRVNSDAPPFDEHTWAAAFERADQAMLDQLHVLYVNDVVLCAFVSAPSEEQAQLEVLSLFPDAKFDKLIQVDESIQARIIALFEQ